MRITIAPRRKKTGGSQSIPSTTSKPTIKTDMGVKYHCDYCRKDISNVVRIRCAICTDFDLCVECYSVGAELSPHKNDHAYRVLTKIDFPIFSEDWGADEELLLLEGIELFGMGNWTDVADHIGTKSKRDVEHHYLEIYTSSEKFPVSEIHRLFSEDQLARFRESRAKLLSEPRLKFIEEPSKPGQSHPANHEIAGFMPYRKEFETEFDNEAETLVRDMTFLEEDSSRDVELKLTVLDIYNSKLNDRMERKKFIFERDLTDFKRQQSLEKRRTKEERDLYNKMRVFSRFQTKEDFETFVSGLSFEMKLRSRIEKLQDYRRNGIRTLLAAEIFEADKRRHDTELNLKKSKESASYLYGEKTTSVHRTHRARERHDEITTTTNSPTTTSRPFSPQVLNPPHLLPTKLPRKPAKPLDIANAESIELLSLRERELCAQVRLFPRQYLAIKEILIREYNRRGGLRKSEARPLIKIDVLKTSKIYDFFISSGWIKPLPMERA